MPLLPLYFFFFFFNDTATTEIYTLSLHDALPISFVIARGSTNGYKRAWVRLVDEDGQEGWGEADPSSFYGRSEEHTSELQSQSNLVCRLLLEKKKKILSIIHVTHDSNHLSRIICA